MSRSRAWSASVACAATLVGAVACHPTSSRTPDEASTTTITSVGIDPIRERDVTTITVTSPEGRSRRVSSRLATDTASGDEDETQSLARAMCERKLVCGDLGPAGQYRSLESCLAEARRHATARLSDRGCLPERSAFGACLASIRAERCSKTLDPTNAIRACNASALCPP